jgi:acetyl-CoA decarbonylase/synthase complex subunit gamma
MENNAMIKTQNDMAVEQVLTGLTFADRFGACKARWGIGRMSYIIKPGLYAVGNPTADSDVLVSANYKMSFDRLREQLTGRDLWIMVINTDGINVWCAAGKRTFGTDEILNRIEETKLTEVVNHRRLILPQLGAPGVKAHEVKQRSGFKVTYGPILSADLPYFLDNNYRATDEMRKVTFSTYDRTVLIPVELVIAAKYAFFVMIGFFLLSGLSRSGYSTVQAFDNGLINAVAFLVAAITGTAIGAILLPWLPGRAFAVKGLWVSAMQIAVLFMLRSHLSPIFANWASIAAWPLLITAITSFMTMNFTGTTTFTSLSGVMKEMKYAVPMQAAAAVIGIALWITSLFINAGA